jgi:hypothetical protein
MDLSKDFSTVNGNRTGHEAYNPASYDDDDDDDFCPLQHLLRPQYEFWALHYNNEM